MASVNPTSSWYWLGNAKREKKQMSKSWYWLRRAKREKKQMTKEHVIYFAEAECQQCDKHFEGHASDVSEEIWHHEEDDGHDVKIADEWEETVKCDDEEKEIL